MYFSRHLQEFSSCVSKQEVGRLTGGGVTARGLRMTILTNNSQRASISAVASLFCVFLSASLVATLPVTPPNIWDCKPLHVDRADPSGGHFEDCCLPTDVPIKDFQFPDPSEPMRIRRNSNYLDQETKEKINRAYEKMRALPDADPRSMHVQQNVHCGYCSNVYKQQNSTKLLGVHRNWLVLPWHRLYVYFHERILASLIDDPMFTIPFWSWDNQSAAYDPLPNSFPVYMTEMPALIDVNRDPRISSPNFPDLSLTAGTFTNVSKEELRLMNTAILHESIVSSSALASTFIGPPYRFGDEVSAHATLFESMPHFSIHTWVGDTVHSTTGVDMRPAYSTARDPIFFQHHSNVDRIFWEWTKLGERRHLPTDPDFLNASFILFDEKGDLVRVTVAQCLDLEKLRISYEPSENAWLEDVSIPLSSSKPFRPRETTGLARALHSVLAWLGHPPDFAGALQSDIPTVESVKLVRFSDSPFHLRVSRPHAALRAAGKLDHLEEVLTVEGIWVPSREEVYFDIFVNLPDANETTPVYATEWCGRFSNAQDIERTRYLFRKFGFSVTIGEKLKKLRLVDQSYIFVSLVPQGKFKHEREVQIDTVRITLQ